MTATADLTASGYEPGSWKATLSGPATLTAANGHITGFDLPSLVGPEQPRPPAPARCRHVRLHPFNTLALSASFANGEGSVTTARLTTQSGTATMEGSTDMVDHDVALRLSLQPDVTPKLEIDNTILGNWNKSRQYPRLHAIRDWTPAP